MKIAPIKMKQVQWIKVDRNANTVWSQLKDDESPIVKAVDFKSLEEQFKVMEKRTSTWNSGTGNTPTLLPLSHDRRQAERVL